MQIFQIENWGKAASKFQPLAWVGLDFFAGSREGRKIISELISIRSDFLAYRHIDALTLAIFCNSYLKGDNFEY